MVVAVETEVQPLLREALAVNLGEEVEADLPLDRQQEEVEEILVEVVVKEAGWLAQIKEELAVLVAVEGLETVVWEARVVLAREGVQMAQEAPTEVTEMRQMVVEVRGLGVQFLYAAVDR